MHIPCICKIQYVYSGTQGRHTAGCNCSHVFAPVPATGFVRQENMLQNCKHQQYTSRSENLRVWVDWEIYHLSILHGLFTSLTLLGCNAINTDQLKYVRHVLFSYISPFGNPHPSSLALSHKVQPHWGSESHGSIRQRCKPKQRQL